MGTSTTPDTLYKPAAGETGWAALVNTNFDTVQTRLLNIVYNAKSYGATGDGSTNDTTAIQAALDAVGAAGGGTVLLPTGTYIVDFVGNDEAGNQYALKVPSNTSLSGVGIGATTIKLKSTTRSASNVTASVIVNSLPITGNVNVAVTALTIDCNRDGQGAYVHGLSLATPAKWTLRGLSLWNVNGGSVPALEILNCPDIAVFIESTGQKLLLGDIATTNCVGAVSFDQVTNGSLVQLTSVNTDAAFTINTTSTTAVTAGQSTVVTPASMTGITTGTILKCALGTAQSESVLVTATTGSTFTAYFGFTKSGTWTVQSERYNSDVALQANVGAVQCSFGNILVDYSAAKVLTGPALELIGCKSVSVASVIAKGTWSGAWIHNFTVAGTDRIVRDCSIASIVCENLQNSYSGAQTNAINIDDNGFTTAAKAVRNISIASAVIVYGEGGASIPLNSNGISINANTVGVTFGTVSIEGPYVGISLNGSQNVTFASVVVRETQQQGIALFNGASSNTFSAVTIINPGLSAAQGQGIKITPHASLVAQDNQFSGLRIRGVSASFWAIDLTGANSVNVTKNTFIGDLVGNTNGLLVDGTAANASKVTPVLGAVAVTVGASPWTYTNLDAQTEAIYIRGGTVSVIAKNSVTLFTASPATVWLESGEAVTITYSSVPTVVKDRK